MTAADRQLEKFLSRYTPELRALGADVVRALSERYPTAVRLVYDNYNALVVGFGATERAGDAFISIALYPRWINLFFLQGASLSDPKGILEGDGKIVRRVTLESAADLDRAPLRAMLGQALRKAPVPLPKEGEGYTVIKSVSAKQRSRKPA